MQTKFMSFINQEIIIEFNFKELIKIMNYIIMIKFTKGFIDLLMDFIIDQITRPKFIKSFINLISQVIVNLSIKFSTIIMVI